MLRAAKARDVDRVIELLDEHRNHVVDAVTEALHQRSTASGVEPVAAVRTGRRRSAS